MPQVDRRNWLKLGGLGLAGLASPAFAQTKGFTHNVASGEPGPTQVLLWTRYVGSGDARLGWEVAEDQTFRTTVASGDVLASSERDWCAKALATGLAPGRWYYYRFIAPSGEVSAVGRTRTLPVGKVPRFRVAVFSCSNLGFGWFNAYAHAVESDAFDLVLHLGDYFYEQARGIYPAKGEAHPERAQPEHEAVTLAGYRDRFATYRADPDLQRLHQMFPMIAMWDDHETANDAWQGGAEGHQPQEGDWTLRKRLSEQAYREWLPVSDAYYAAYEIGQLATLFRLETRHLARDKQLDAVAAFTSADPGQGAAALAALRDGAWRDPARTLLGAAQDGWLAGELRRSAKARKPWQVLGQQLVMGGIALPGTVLNGLPSGAPSWLRARLDAAVVAGQVGLPYSMDMWGGYPAARGRLLASAQAAGANLLVLAGDSHNAWAVNLSHDGDRAGVEMAGHSVTSPGAEGTLPWVKPVDLARGMLEQNPQLQWCNTSQRGYLALELTPQAATGEWRFLASVRQKGTALASTKRMTVLAGQQQFTRS